MKIKFKNFAAAVFLLVIIYFMCSVLAVFGMTLIDKARGVIVITSPEDDKFVKLYPFDERDEELEELNKINNAQGGAVKNFIDVIKDKVYKNITEKINEQEKKIEAYTTDKLKGYMTFTELARKYEALMHWNVSSIAEYNNIIELADGHFSTLVEKRDVNYSAKNVIKLAEFCGENNIKLLYVNAPAKICAYEDANISGVIDFVNQNADEFLKILEINNINYLDFRKILHSENLSHHAAFFKTDHHWLPSIGLWAARRIAEYLRREYKYDIRPEILDNKNFKTITYPKWFLGSHGKKVTLSRAQPDDFDLIYPKFKTSIRFVDLMNDTDVTGDFNLMYDMKDLQEKNYYKDNPHAAYPTGFAEQKYNNLNNNNLKILMLHDSFGDNVIPFLTLAVKRLDCLDLRVFMGSVRSYIKTHRPDCVIIIYHSGIIAEKSANEIRNVFDMR